MLISKQPE